MWRNPDKMTDAEKLAYLRRAHDGDLVAHARVGTWWGFLDVVWVVLIIATLMCAAMALGQLVTGAWS